MSFCGDLQQLNQQTKIIILIGESGAGKSTFAKALGIPASWFVSSDLIIKEIKARDLPVNHDTIHETAKRRYGEDPYWQIPYMISVLEKTGMLLLDGPRRIDEVDELLKRYPQSIIIGVFASTKERRKRLGKRDGADEEAFKRIILDEQLETNLGDRLLSMAHITIRNDGSIEDLEKIAREVLIKIKG
jgi:dephospho-CoA kinase